MDNKTFTLESMNLDTLNALEMAIQKEKERRKRVANQKYINNFCCAFAELVLNVPSAVMPDPEDPDADILAMFVPENYPDFSAEDLADYVKGFIGLA